MEKLIKTKTPLIVVALFFILFNVLFFVCVDFKNANKLLWIGYAFIVVSFLIFGGLAGFLKLKSKNTMTTIWPLMYATSGYFVLNFIINFIFILVNNDNVTAGIVTNVVILILYCVVFVIAYKSFLRVQDNTVVRETRVNELRQTETKVSTLIYMTSSTAVKKALQELKENISYSTSAGTPESTEYEQKFSDYLDVIKELLNSDASDDSLLKAIADANQALKLRNQIVMTSRK